MAVTVGKRNEIVEKSVSKRLRSHPFLVLLSMVAGVAACIVISYHVPGFASRRHRVGIASESALVDSPKSQVADLGSSSGSDITDLAYRASLLASLMTSSPLEDQIAQRSGIAPGDLIATGPATAVGSDSPAPSVPSASVSASNPKASTLSATVPTLAAGQIPVIQISTQAPTPAIAASLAENAFAVLEANINSLALADNVPGVQRVVIRTLGAAQSTWQTSGPSLLDGILAAILIFVMGCGAIVGRSTRRSARRAGPTWADADLARYHEPPEPVRMGAAGDSFRAHRQESAMLIPPLTLSLADPEPSDAGLTDDDDDRPAAEPEPPLVAHPATLQEPPGAGDTPVASRDAAPAGPGTQSSGQPGIDDLGDSLQRLVAGYDES